MLQHNLLVSERNTNWLAQQAFSMAALGFKCVIHFVRLYTLLGEWVMLLILLNESLRYSDMIALDDVEKGVKFCRN